MIIIGYQGIGKSTLGGTGFYIDLESSNFFIDGKRPEGWEKIYCKIAKDLDDQGYDIFVSCHQEVRDELAKIANTNKVAIIYPSLELKDVWLGKLKERYDNDPSEKNMKALKYAEEHYDENIKALDNGGCDYFFDMRIEDEFYELAPLIDEIASW